MWYRKCIVISRLFQIIEIDFDTHFICELCSKDSSYYYYPDVRDDSESCYFQPCLLHCVPQQCVYKSVYIINSFSVALRPLCLMMFMWHLTLMCRDDVPLRFVSFRSLHAAGGGFWWGTFSSHFLFFVYANFFCRLFYVKWCTCERGSDERIVCVLLRCEGCSGGGDLWPAEQMPEVSVFYTHTQTQMCCRWDVHAVCVLCVLCSVPCTVSSSCLNG